MLADTFLSGFSNNSVMIAQVRYSLKTALTIFFILLLLYFIFIYSLLMEVINIYQSVYKFT